MNDKLYLWAKWSQNGAGCLCCSNHCRAKQNKGLQVQPSKWAAFKALPKSCHQLKQHERQSHHQDVLRFHFTGSLLAAIPEEDDDAGSRPVVSKTGKPTISALRRLIKSVERHVSLEAFVELEKESHKDEGFHSRQACVDALQVLAETQRYFWLRRLQLSTLFVSSDAVGRTDVVDWQAVDNKLDVFSGTFGITRDHNAINHECEQKSLGVAEDNAAAKRLADAVAKSIVAFCTLPGDGVDVIETKVQRVKDNVRGISFDGAAYAQVASRMLGREAF